MPQIYFKERKGRRMAKKKYKQIQAGQDWSDPDTWYGLVLAIVVTAGLMYAGWTVEPFYNWK